MPLATHDIVPLASGVANALQARLPTVVLIVWFAGVPVLRVTAAQLHDGVKPVPPPWEGEPFVLFNVAVARENASGPVGAEGAARFGEDVVIVTITP